MTRSAGGVETRRPLLITLQQLLERTYRMETGVRDIGPFVIGDEGYRRFYVRSATAPLQKVSSARSAERTRPPSTATLQRVSSARRGGRALRGTASEYPRSLTCEVAETYRDGQPPRPSPSEHPRSLLISDVGEADRGCEKYGPGARVLVHDGPGPIGAHLYYPDALIRTLENEPPTAGLNERNIDAFHTFVEELDHFLLIAERARLRMPVSLLELEMHAEVTKYLVSALFLAAERPAVARPEPDGGRTSASFSRAGLDPRRRAWLLWHLFEKAEFAEPDPEVQDRYRDAARFARRFLARLEALPSAGARLALLRSFHDSTHQEKVAALA